MSKALESKINELFAATKDLKSLEEIKPYCEAFNVWVNQQSYSDKSLGTLFSRYGLYSKFRSIPLQQGENADSVPKHDAEGKITGYRLLHYVPLLCGLDNKGWAERNTTSRVITRVVEGKDLDPEKYLSVAGKLLVSDDPNELAVGLIAATGRRPHEILSRATFTAVQGKDYVVRFAGQGKKRGEKPVFEIPVLFPARYVVERLKRLRADAGLVAMLREIEQEFPNSITRQNVEIDKRRNQSLNRVVREYFGGKRDGEAILELRYDDVNQNNKALRAAYAALVTERDCQGGLGAKILFASRLLGHFQAKKEKESDRDLIKLGTTAGYLDYVVKKPIPFPSAPKPESTKTVRVFATDFDAILKIQKDGGFSTQQDTIRHLLKPVDKDLALRNELMEARTENSQLSARIKQLEAQIEQLQTEKIKEVQMTEQQTVPFDAEAFKADILNSVSQLVQAQLAAFKPEISQVSNQATQAPQATSPKAEEIDWESKSHAELWASKASGAASEKIRRSFQAITAYNDTIATGDNDRLAVTNQALRTLSGVNGLLVGDWIKAHADEVVGHNLKHGMQNPKDPSKTETYFNKSHGRQRIEQILTLISEEFLEGEALKAKA